jgi:enolase
MVALYEDWVRQYPIVSIEDGLAEGRLGRLEAAHPRRSATACSSSATTSS